MNKPLKIGLTGGIGAGKSTVCDMFAQLGVPVIDADLISRQLATEDKLVIEQIKDLFGPDFLLENGKPDRTRLRNLIFSDQVKKQQLESILHPRIYELIDNKIAGIIYPYCIISVPLLVEHGETSKYNRILVVDSNLESQVSRAQQRDSVSENDIKKIMTAQASRSDRLSVADDIILNNGDIENVKEQVTRLHEKYLSLAAGPEPVNHTLNR